MKDINKAIGVFFACQYIPGGSSEAFNNLLKLRNAKTTWVGEDENRFRFKLDTMLDEYCPAWRSITAA